jgi:predicted dehydrogenase
MIMSDTSSRGEIINIAIVGCGTIAPTHADAIAEAPEIGARVTACCDIVPEKAQAFAEKYGLRAMSWAEALADPDIDAVSICTPSGLHTDLGVEAMLAGKHVVIEKPLDVTPEACDRLIAAQRETGKVLACISQHRFDPATIFVRDALERGDLGKTALAEARVTWYRTQQYYDSGDWRGTWALDGGGCLMNQGVHTVDLMLWLCGPATSVYAQTRTLGHERIEVEDCVAATVTFANGAIGTIIASTAAYPGFPVRLAVHGTHGTAILEGDALQTYAVIGEKTVHGHPAAAHAIGIATGGTRSMGTASTAIPTSTTSNNEGVEEAETEDGEFPGAPAKWGDSHKKQLADFVRCCRTGETPLVDGVQAKAAVELILAVYESARTGQVVKLSTERQPDAPAPVRSAAPSSRGEI